MRACFIILLFFYGFNSFGQGKDSTYKKFIERNGAFFFLVEIGSEIKLYKDTSKRSDFKILTDDHLFRLFGDRIYLYGFTEFAGDNSSQIELEDFAIALRENEALHNTRWKELLIGIDDYKFTDIKFKRIIDWDQLLDNYLSYQSYKKAQESMVSVDTCDTWNNYFHVTIDKIKNQVRNEPDDLANIIYPNDKIPYCYCGNYIVEEINGDWIKIKPSIDYCCKSFLNGLKGSCVKQTTIIEEMLFKEGWIRWRNQSDLLVKIYFNH